MSDATIYDRWPSDGPTGSLAPHLEDVIACVPAEGPDTINLPREVRPGSFSFSYMANTLIDWGPQWEDIEFEWSGSRSARWMRDISAEGDTGPGSSAPVDGHASWLNGRDLLLAYVSPELQTEGWARVPGGAPTSESHDLADDVDALSDPFRWVRLARIITAVTYERPIAGMTAERYRLW